MHGSGFRLTACRQFTDCGGEKKRNSSLWENCFSRKGCLGATHRDLLEMSSVGPECVQTQRPLESSSAWPGEMSAQVDLLKLERFNHCKQSFQQLPYTLYLYTQYRCEGKSYKRRMTNKGRFVCVAAPLRSIHFQARETSPR